MAGSGPIEARRLSKYKNPVSDWIGIVQTMLLGRLKGKWFDDRQVWCFLFSRASRPNLGPTQPSLQHVPAVRALDEKSHATL